MINSLSKDSHITRGQSYHKLSPKQISVRPNLGSKTTAKNCEIIMNKPAEPSFCGFFNAEKFYKSNALKSTLKFADDQQLVFGAAFSLLLTCIMRPASIMVLPSKKNKDDQKYASGHSIASGVIGFGISTVVFTPISSAIKKFTANPEKFLDEGHYLLKNNKSAMKAGKQYLDRLPDIITAVPKGILTIALIPPIMKYVFGLEKKSAKGTSGSSSSVFDYSLLNFKSANIKNHDRFAYFQGGLK